MDGHVSQKQNTEMIKNAATVYDAIVDYGL